MCWNLSATVQAEVARGAALRGRGLPVSPLLELELVVGPLLKAESRVDLALQAAGAAARLTRQGPCLVALEASGGDEAILASSSGRTLPVGRLAELGLLPVRAANRRWIAAERLGHGPDDPPIRLAARFPVVPPGLRVRSMGAVLVFESRGAGPIDPAASSSVRILASLAGSILAATSQSATSCDCSAEAEQSRILAELHDGLLQNLYGLVLEIEAATTQSAYPPAALDAARRWRQILAGAIDETRSILERLDGCAAGVPELGAGLDMLAAEAAVGSGVDVDTQIILGCEVTLPDEFRRGVLAVAREALRNSVRHSGAWQVRVRVQVDGQGLQLVVEDDGVGFSPDEVRRGHGLRSMAARAATLGGSLDVTSGPGRGARVSLWAPLAGTSTLAGTLVEAVIADGRPVE